jgi:hypothetical protein
MDAEKLKLLSPSERITYLREQIDACIALTPTGAERNLMTAANIALMMNDPIQSMTSAAQSSKQFMGDVAKRFRESGFIETDESIDTSKKPN